MTDTLDTLTAAAAFERQKLQRHFGRFDILFFLICTIVGVDTIATVAKGGGQAFTWMVVFAVVFRHGASVSTPVWYIIALVFVWLSIVAAIMSFSVGKWLPTAGAVARFVVLGLFTISVIIYAVKHGAHGLGASAYSPTAGGFVLLVGVLLFNFVG